VTPVTTPVDDPTVATAVLLLLQVPPNATSISIIPEPMQTLPGPVIVPALEMVPIVIAKVVVAVPQPLVIV
jgi:hypothetical protein